MTDDERNLVFAALALRTGRINEIQFTDAWLELESERPAPSHKF